MKYKLKELHKNIDIVFTDSKDYSITKDEWLPGGTITSYWERISSLVNKQQIKIDKLGKWSSLWIKKPTKNNFINIIVLYTE